MGNDSFGDRDIKGVKSGYSVCAPHSVSVNYVNMHHAMQQYDQHTRPLRVISFHEYVKVCSFDYRVGPAVI